MTKQSQKIAQVVNALEKNSATGLLDCRKDYLTAVAHHNQVRVEGFKRAIVDALLEWVSSPIHLVHSFLTVDPLYSVRPRPRHKFAFLLHTRTT